MIGHVSLVGAGPGDPDLWTVRATQRVRDADLVLYDALVDADALRALTGARCFCVGKRAGRASVRQETINALMIRAARQGKRVVRLKGGDPFVFGRGAEEAHALARAGIPCEVVPGVSTAIGAPELAGIPVTHRGVASAFLVLAGVGEAALDRTLAGIRPNSLTLVVMMGLASRQALGRALEVRGWSSELPAAIVCAASTPQAWTWTGRLGELAGAQPPAGLAGVIVIGEVVGLREVVQAVSADAGAAANEVRYGRNR